jgi:hypothetical protein
VIEGPWCPVAARWQNRRPLMRRLPCPRICETALAGSMLLGASDAAAYCLKTTCDPVVQTCQIDAQGCVAEGAPLYWPDGVVGDKVRRVDVASVRHGYFPSGGGPTSPSRTVPWEIAVGGVAASQRPLRRSMPPRRR